MGTVFAHAGRAAGESVQIGHMERTALRYLTDRSASIVLQRDGWTMVTLGSGSMLLIRPETMERLSGAMGR